LRALDTDSPVAVGKLEHPHRPSRLSPDPTQSRALAEERHVSLMPVRVLFASSPPAANLMRPTLEGRLISRGYFSTTYLKTEAVAESLSALDTCTSLVLQPQRQAQRSRGWLSIFTISCSPKCVSSTATGSVVTAAMVLILCEEKFIENHHLLIVSPSWSSVKSKLSHLRRISTSVGPNCVPSGHFCSPLPSVASHWNS
jgi:hypothetical protein